MRLIRKAALCGTAFALASAFTLAACSDDSNGGDDTISLEGTYSVVGFGTAPAPTMPTVTPLPEGVTGTAVLTATRYDVSVPGLLESEGEYKAYADGSFQQAGTASFQGGQEVEVQCARANSSYTLVNDILTIDVTCLGQRTITVFQLND